MRDPIKTAIESFGRGVCLAATLWVSFALHGSEPWLDENLVRQAMQAEAYRQLAQKIDAERHGLGGGFDYHIEQAYAKIRHQLPDGMLSAGELEIWLQGVPSGAGGGDENEFKVLIDHFILGMSLEIINTLQYECEQVEDLIARVAKSAAELRKAPRRDREALDAVLADSELTRKTRAIVRDIERRWRDPEPGADDFSAYAVWKKNMTGVNADRDLRLVFDLGRRYRPRYAFLDQFMAEYRRLAGAFRQAALDLNALLDENHTDAGKG